MKERISELESFQREAIRALAELEKWFCLEHGPTMEPHSVRDERTGAAVNGMKCRVCGAASYDFALEVDPDAY